MPHLSGAGEPLCERFLGAKQYRKEVGAEGQSLPCSPFLKLQIHATGSTASTPRLFRLRFQRISTI